MMAESQSSQGSQLSAFVRWEDMTAEEKEAKIEQWRIEAAAVPKTKIGRLRAIVTAGPYGVKPGRARRLSARIDRHIGRARHYARAPHMGGRSSFVFGLYDHRARVEGDHNRAAVSRIEDAAGLPFSSPGILSAGGAYTLYYLAAGDLDSYRRGNCFVLCVDCANAARRDRSAIVFGYGGEHDTDSLTVCEDCGKVIIEDWDKEDLAGE